MEDLQKILKEQQYRFNKVLEFCNIKIHDSPRFFQEFNFKTEDVECKKKLNDKLGIPEFTQFLCNKLNISIDWLKYGKGDVFISDYEISDERVWLNDLYNTDNADLPSSIHLILPEKCYNPILKQQETYVSKLSEFDSNINYSNVNNTWHDHGLHMWSGCWINTDIICITSEEVNGVRYNKIQSVMSRLYLDSYNHLIIIAGLSDVFIDKFYIQFYDSESMKISPFIPNEELFYKNTSENSKSVLDFLFEVRKHHKQLTKSGNCQDRDININNKIEGLKEKTTEGKEILSYSL